MPTAVLGPSSPGLGPGHRQGPRGRGAAGRPGAVHPCRSAVRRRMAPSPKPLICAAHSRMLILMEHSADGRVVVCQGWRIGQGLRAARAVAGAGGRSRCPDAVLPVGHELALAGTSWHAVADEGDAVRDIAAVIGRRGGLAGRDGATGDLRPPRRDLRYPPALLQYPHMEDARLGAGTPGPSGRPGEHPALTAGQEDQGKPATSAQPVPRRCGQGLHARHSRPTVQCRDHPCPLITAKRCVEHRASALGRAGGQRGPTSGRGHADARGGQRIYAWRRSRSVT